MALAESGQIRSGSRSKRVLVADDSALFRFMVSDALSGQGFEVVLAKDGQEAVSLAKSAKPDVAVLDVNMPKLNGIEVLKEFVPMGIPSIMFSSVTANDSKVTMDALDIGAVDFLPKPGSAAPVDLKAIKEELVRNVKIASISRLVRRPPRTAVTFAKSATEGSLAKHALLIAASTGGPAMVKAVIQSLPQSLGAAVLIVQHMPPFFTKAFAEHLSDSSKIPVKEAVNGEPIYTNNAYVAPGDYHMEVAPGALPKILLHQGPKVNYVRPAADPLFVSAASHFGGSILAVVLTGMGSDGAKGALAVKSRGGHVIVQDEATSVVYGMPKAVVKEGAADEILSIDTLVGRVPDMVRRLVNS